MKVEMICSTIKEFAKMNAMNKQVKPMDGVPAQ